MFFSERIFDETSGRQVSELSNDPVRSNKQIYYNLKVWIIDNMDGCKHQVRHYEKLEVGNWLSTGQRSLSFIQFSKWRRNGIKCSMTYSRRFRFDADREMTIQWRKRTTRHKHKTFDKKKRDSTNLVVFYTIIILYSFAYTQCDNRTQHTHAIKCVQQKHPHRVN